MDYVYQLTLPCPSAQLVEKITSLVSNIKFNNEGKQWLDELNNISNTSSHSFFTDSEVDQMVEQEYGNYFQRPIGAIIGVMSNSNSDTGCQPPHVDSARALGLNCYISLGGDNVKTTFYNHVGETKEVGSTNIPYAEIQDQKIGSIVFEKEKWYTFEACRLHSVENIKTTRTFLCIYIKGPTVSYKLEDLVNDYPMLLGNSLELT